MNKIIGHACFTSKSGYGYHARGFFSALNKHIQVRISNASLETDISVLTQEQRDMIIYQQYDRYPWEIGREWNEEKYNWINILLHETLHPEYFKSHKGKRIAYNVWETTKQPAIFFERLMEMDQVWVPSSWQFKWLTEQGMPEDRIRIVPEGITDDIYYKDTKTKKVYGDDRFKFIVVGRWEERKAITEIIQAFLNSFHPSEPVDMVLFVDNPFDFKSNTFQKMQANNFNVPRLKVYPFLSRKKYLKYLRGAHTLVSCSRSEGWGIPIAEAIGCGVPVISTNWGPSLDFTKDIAHLVDIKGLIKAKSVQNENVDVGEYADPDFKHLEFVMRDAYINHRRYKADAVDYSYQFIKNYSYDSIIPNTLRYISEVDKKPLTIEKDRISITYFDGAQVTVSGNSNNSFDIKLFNAETNKIIKSEIVSTGNKLESNEHYYIPWKVNINNNDVHTLDLIDKNVLITFESKALGDTLAWIPACEEFRKKHKCNLTVVSNWINLLAPGYPKINFAEKSLPIQNYVAWYKFGVFDNDENRNVKNWRTLPLQDVASLILGLKPKEIKPNIVVSKKSRPIKDKYIAISEYSTFKCKHWLYPNGWQIIIDWLAKKGYKTMVISKEPTLLKNIIDMTNKPLEESINNIIHAEAFVSVSTGPSWLAWALNKPLVLISGYSEDWQEMKFGNNTNVERIINKDECYGCFSDPSCEFNRADWNWCPRNNDMICSKSITPDMVKKSLRKLLNIED